MCEQVFMELLDYFPKYSYCFIISFLTTNFTVDLRELETSLGNLSVCQCGCLLVVSSCLVWLTIYTLTDGYMVNHCGNILFRRIIS